ncbi:GtrA family protein [Natrinema versiforme]|uniref:GtrA family protein n=1 Tax=Natrinema versiforme JCM 10478 TaxID=1227496 RepID=L9YAG2_9EURY|nr:GtrA family protein [Natrinema versiforme]ELY71025.1 GtrA family protein [Natrinema versiforme JCM 10478]
MSNSLSEAVRTRIRALRSTARFSQFVGVGTLGATVDNAVLFLLIRGTGLGLWGAKLIAWELGIAVIFAVNEQWTFSSHGESGIGPLARRFGRSNAVRFGGLLVTLAVLTLLTERFDVWFMAANVIGIGVGFFVNYTCESLYTWQVHQE